MLERSAKTEDTLVSHTPARIALTRTGDAVSTGDTLAFQLDHARARDAVHQPADLPTLAHALRQAGYDPIKIESAIPPGPSARQTYLRRPDLGRTLNAESAEALKQCGQQGSDAAIILADGLSALALERHALPLLETLIPFLADWTLAPIALVRNARVAIADQIGATLGAKLTILLIGERPGLTAPDSLGVYLTWNPRVGNTDADRNCISNIRLEGLSYKQAAARIAFYANAARAANYSGFALKDSSSPNLPPVR
jgi:ethanolamine ammonia-lyase small subunit